VGYSVIAASCYYILALHDWQWLEYVVYLKHYLSRHDDFRRSRVTDAMDVNMRPCLPLRIEPI
jgi:hypothetical protein